MLAVLDQIKDQEVAKERKGIQILNPTFSLDRGIRKCGVAYGMTVASKRFATVMP